MAITKTRHVSCVFRPMYELQNIIARPIFRIDTIVFFFTIILHWRWRRQRRFHFVYSVTIDIIFKWNKFKTHETNIEIFIIIFQWCSIPTFVTKKTHIINSHVCHATDWISTHRMESNAKKERSYTQSYRIDYFIE